MTFRGITGSGRHIWREATLAGQYEVLLSNLIHEIEVSQIHRELQEKVKENIDKNQKDYILREQLKVIREELGEDPLSDADEYEKQLASLKADKEVKEKLQKEIDRLKGMPGGGQESNVHPHLYRDPAGASVE